MLEDEIQGRHMHLCIKHQGHTILWEGKARRNYNVDVLTNALQIAHIPSTGELATRLVYRVPSGSRHHT